MHEPRQPCKRPAPDISLFRVRGLAYRYPDETLALSGIDMDIAAGDRVAVVGQNGSGKTTLLKLLCGLLTPTTGEVLFKTHGLENSCPDRDRLKIGLLFQDPDDQLFCHTLLEDTAFGPRQQGLPRQDSEQKALQALKRVSLDDKAYKAPHNLSFGQKKRAALAGLLAMEPEVLLLDEPTANLDPRQEQVFLDLLKGFSGTLICISHDLIFLYELCDRAVVMDHGQIQHDYAMSDLVSQRQALRAHGLDFSFRLVITPSMSGGGPATDSTRTRIPYGSISPYGGSDDKGNEPLAVFRNYHYRYPDGTHALKDINITIHDKERISIVGENGAGKTTLLSGILGLRQGQGDFRFLGRPVTRKRRRALWRQVGMVFQDCADQLFCSSVREEITFGLRQLGYSKAESRKRLTQTLSMVHLEGFEERVPLHLSGGERKRLALACVLAMEPRLLILDEPTAGLDPQGEELLLTILRDLDVTLLLVSHDMFFVRELTDRTVVMHQGQILEDMTTHAFQQEERLGNLNGLSYAYRQRSSSAIQTLQHEHEIRHSHRHLHPHRHLHEGEEHEHVHEHIHEHTHRIVHSHPGEEKAHDHMPRRFHDHDHFENDSE